MQLASIEMPQTFYNISQKYGNNYLYLAVRDEFFYDWKVFIIPDGNYTKEGLIKALNFIVSPKNPEDCSLECPDSLFSYIRFDLDLEVEGSGSGKVYIHTCPRFRADGTPNPLLFVNMDFSRDINGQSDNNPISQRIGWTLGFTQCKYEGCIEYRSDTPIQVNTIPYFYLAIDDFNNSVNNGFLSIFAESILNPNILARIAITNRCADFSTMIIQENANLITQPREYFGPVDIQKLQIRIYDSYGRILDLNGRDYSFCLLFKMLYDL
jgi:hypothetical protein